jgi:predicted site-specific integrase-resolvase
MDPNLIEPIVLAERWGVTLHTLSQWRWRGGGPAFIKTGRKVHYHKKDIIEYEEQLRRTNTSISRAA